MINMDNHTPEQRKKNMQAIRSKDSKIEVVLRKALWEKGYRYRKNYKKLIGKPDIVFIGKKVAVFCDSEFWHGKDYHACVDRIETNSSYWKQKIKRNIERDLEVTKDLEEQGWTVHRFWESEILKETDKCVELIERSLHSERGI
jgi:DNA mismatch endonuclease vsr